MSDGIKRWHEDMDEYSRLCEKYGEKPETMIGADGHRYIASNCNHHRELIARERTERERQK